MNELEQIKQDLKKALERVEQLENKSKELTLDEILVSYDNRYYYDDNKRFVYLNIPRNWRYYKDKAEAEHEMWRLILKRVAQYLNAKYGKSIINDEYYCFFIDSKNRLIYDNLELPIIPDGRINFETKGAIEEAKKIMGEDNIKKALSEEYCRKNQE